MEKRVYQGREVDDGGGHHGKEQRQLECFSDEVDSRGGVEVVTKDIAGGAGGGASAASCGVGMGDETGKRRRGRPPGSKNKPKPPVVVTRDAAEPAAAAMRPYVLEIPGGGDIASALAGFARYRGLGICVLAGTGAVADVSLRHPSPPDADGGGAAAAAAIVFRGRYEILSISATFLPPSMSAAAMPRALGNISVSLAGPHGRIVGGAVAGPLVAATTVVVVAAAFTSPTFHRLPAEDAVDAPPSASGSGEADKHRGRQPEPPEQHHHAGRLQPQSMAPATRPVSLYACHGHPHEVWTPVASTPSPRPQYE